MPSTPTESYNPNRKNPYVGGRGHESKAWWETQDQYGAATEEALRDAESGKSSVAQQQLRQGLTQAQRGMASASTGRGSNPLAQRAAMYSGGQMAAEVSGQSAALRAAEMQAARAAQQQYYQQYAAGQQQYDAMALQSAIAQAQIDAQMQQAKMADEAAAQERAIQWGATIAGAASSGAGAAMMSDARVKELSGTTGRVAELARAYEALDAETTSRLAGGGGDPRVASLGAALDAEGARTSAQLAGGRRVASLADDGAQRSTAEHMSGRMYSDERVKSLSAALDEEDARMQHVLRAPGPKGPYDQQAEEVGRRLDAEADETMRQLQAHRFRYRPEAQQMGAPPGERAGIMAQDLERTPLGASAVSEDPAGIKRIDIPQTASLAAGLAGRAGRRLDDHATVISDLERRLARLERGGP